MADEAMSDTGVSKLLSLLLRHQPDKLGLALDSHGWVQLDDVVAALNEHGIAIDRARILQVVAGSDKQRFAISADRRCIRAQQGHTVSVDLDLRPAIPPARLYHGTVVRFLPAIMRDGLLRGERHHVHLSPDVETARRVGARRGPPVVLCIDASAMLDNGHTFFVTRNRVWLTEHVPPQYLGELRAEDEGPH